MKLIIDPLLCEANGVCTRILPEALELDAEDALQLRLATIPAQLEQRARKAVHSCPRQALRLEPA